MSCTITRSFKHLCQRIVLSLVIVAGLVATAQTALAGGISFNAVTGVFAGGPFDPTLSGGDFTGRLISSLMISDIADVRDSAGSQLVLRGPSGLNLYDVVAGGFVVTLNPTLSGGDFTGRSLSSLSINNIASVRDIAGSQVVLLGPSGLDFYDVNGGGFAGAFNPTLSGGLFAGRLLSSLSINDIAAVRDNTGAQLALFSGVPVSEPSSLVLCVVGTAVLGCAAWRRRSQADQGRARGIKG